MNVSLFPYTFAKNHHDIVIQEGQTVVDLLIVGSGPAGLSAALSAKARNLSFLWFGTRHLSAKIEKAERIMNYPGLSAVTGLEMQNAFLHQIHEAGIELLETRIDSVYDMGGYFAACANDQFFEGKSIILATGMTNAKEIPGESEFLGKGVSYCATCDGALYTGKDIAVVCTEPELEEEIPYLACMARHITVFTNYLTDRIQGDNITHQVGYPSAIGGENRVQWLRCGSETITVDGVFCLRSSVNPAVLLQGLAIENGHILVDRQQQTNIPGCFAAGDCTGRPYQYAKAVGEGNVALHSASAYLSCLKKDAAS